MKEFLSKIFRSSGFKFIVIGILSLLLLIPSAMIKQLITERQSRSMEAAREISEKWGTAQTVTGPFLTIPYREEIKGKEEEIKTVYSNLHILPDALKIESNVSTEEKKRGIFRTAVYTSELVISGKFILPGDELEKNAGKELYRDAFFMNFGLSDLRGIHGHSEVRVDGKPVKILPGLPDHQVTESGVNIPLEVTMQQQKEFDFEIRLNLNGSSHLFFCPLGKETSVEISSSWADPSFSGSFLPRNKHISNDGFDARWEVNYLNRNYPQYWYGDSYNVNESDFGVVFLIPVDHYQKSMRTIKYAFMFIALTFLILFLTEMIAGIRLHPIQYLLIGFTLVIFYTLLISLSEHFGFNTAYIISTTATTSLIGIYILASTRAIRSTIITWLLLLILYAFLFTTIQLQDYSLLMGSVGIFIVLALIMFVSRKINWYKEVIKE